MSGITWIKLSTGFYDDEKIKLIESLPEGDATIIIFQRLLILAGKINEKGKISLSKDQPYTPEMLAVLFNRNPQITKNALVTLQQFGMINICEKGFIFVANWGHHQNIEGMERVKELTRKRVAKHREKKKLLTEGNEENVTLQKRYVTQKNKNKNQNKNKNTGDVFFIDIIPDELKNIDGFIDSWIEWFNYRKELKKKLTKSSAVKQLKLLSQYPDDAKDIIEKSITNSWQGLFPINNNNQKGNHLQQSEQNLYKKTQTELLYEEMGL